jgi:hypothetical protein
MMMMMSLNSSLAHYIKLILNTWLCILQNGGALYLVVSTFIVIEKLGIGGCTMIIFLKLQHMTLLSFDAGV